MIVGTGGTAYATTRSTGLYVSTDSGMTWSPTGSTPLTEAGSQDPVVLLLFGSGLRGFSSVQAFVAGQEVTVFGLAAQSEFVGLDQVNIDLPDSLAGVGVVEVDLLIDGVRTNSVLVEVE